MGEEHPLTLGAVDAPLAFLAYNPARLPTQRGGHQQLALLPEEVRQPANTAVQKSMFQSSLSTFVRATGQYGHPAHPPRLVAPTALAGGASSSSRPPLDVIEPVSYTHLTLPTKA